MQGKRKAIQADRVIMMLDVIDFDQADVGLGAEYL